jgi:PAS domain S-box-containing protein
MATRNRREALDLEDTEFVGSLMASVKQLRAAQDELEAERRRYRALFQHAPLAHLTTDARGRILDANDATADLLQADAASLVAKDLSTFVVPDERVGFQSWFTKATDADRPVFRFAGLRSVTFDAEVRVSANEDGLGWVLRDVTEELRSKRAISELKRELARAVAEHAAEIATVYDWIPVGIAVVSAADGNAFRLNHRGREILGDEFPLHPLAERALAGEEVRGELVPLSDRSSVLEVTAAPVRGVGDSITAATLSFHDVTDRDRLDRADREFVSNAAHQLRTPITAIAAALAALKAGAGEDVEERSRFLDHLETETERLARIIDAMLVLSRAQRRELDPALTLVRLRPLLQRLASEVTPAPGVDVSWQCDHELGVIAHQALLEEAIANALTNAVEHTRIGTVSVTAEKSGDEIVIEVADTGRGMEPAIRDRAFERFFSSTPTRRSAGLGLAIAAAAVRASRGTIELDSEPGEGTRLRIRLRAAPLRRA